MIQRDGLLLLAGAEAVAVEPVVGDDEVQHAVAGLRDADLAPGISGVRAVGHGVLHEDGIGEERAAAIAGDGEGENDRGGSEDEARAFHRAISRASKVSGAVEIAANSAGRQGRGAKR